ncbi:hypothetical protein HN018_06790 [Lichenicola cladoniae]|uniref:Uncharacterized protein n=1 Tax=Lichenicola cladoniae TaxID=1484109 RepID=A0A6M8HMY8_9PROT|nr:hypothetical protein [Lichenicola cladoniae]NPD67279.1 hypothetical protein [Acetobacteraceae bacterium]QKE89783.1 hypothetical protein HN018_06790 [Lichenicola cladoniae]
MELVMSILPPGEIILGEQLVSEIEVTVVPAGRRGLRKSPAHPRLPMDIYRDDYRTILPTVQRRQHLQDLVEETVELEPPVTEVRYDPVSRENFTRLIKDGVYGRATRVARGVATLQRSGKIDSEEVKAAERYTREYEYGMSRMRLASLESGRGGTGGNAQGVSDAQLDAQTSVRLVRQALGAEAEARLRLLLIEDVSFAKMAEALVPASKKGDEEMKAQAAILLTVLAAHYKSR